MNSSVTNGLGRVELAQVLCTKPSANEEEECRFPLFRDATIAATNSQPLLFRLNIPVQLWTPEVCDVESPTSHH